jgi:hypothetical protein
LERRMRNAFLHRLLLYEYRAKKAPSLPGQRFLRTRHPRKWQVFLQDRPS